MHIIIDMYTQGHNELKIDINRVIDLPFKRYPLPDLSTWHAAKYYDKDKITDSLCSDKTAEEHGLDWKWTDALRIEQWKICAVAFYKLSPGHVTPWHTDHFSRFSDHYKVNKKDVVRRLVFLQPWRPGQIFCIEDETITNWKPGDWVEWTSEHSHMGANHSDGVRYTLQLTGVR